MKNKNSDFEIKYRSMTNNMTEIIYGSKAFNNLVEGWNDTPFNICDGLKIMLLGNSNQLQGILSITNTGSSACLDKIKSLFSLILNSSTKAIVTYHHSQSVIKDLSRNEIDMYEKIKKFAGLYKIKYLDSIISTEDRIFSGTYDDFRI